MRFVANQRARAGIDSTGGQSGGSCGVLEGRKGFYGVLEGHKRFYGVLEGHKRFYRVLEGQLGPIGSWKVNWVL